MVVMLRWPGWYCWLEVLMMVGPSHYQAAGQPRRCKMLARWVLHFSLKTIIVIMITITVSYHS